MKMGHRIIYLRRMASPFQSVVNGCSRYDVVRILLEDRYRARDGIHFNQGRTKEVDNGL